MQVAGLQPLLADSQLGGGQQLSDSDLNLLMLLRQNSASNNNLQGLGTSSLAGLGSSLGGSRGSLGGLGSSNSFSGLGTSSLGGLGGGSSGGLGSSSFTGSSLGGSSRQQQLPALGAAFQASPRPGSGSALTSSTSLGSSLSSAASLLSSSQPSSSSSLFPSSRPASASALLPSRPSLTFADSAASQRGQQQQQEGGSLQFEHHERDSLIGHLIGLEQSGSKLVLTPRQRQALEEEARVRLVASPSPSTSRAPASASAASRNNVFSSLGATQARDSLLSSFGNRQQQGFGSLPGEELINNKPLILLSNKMMSVIYLPLSPESPRSSFPRSSPDLGRGSLLSSPQPQVQARPAASSQQPRGQVRSRGHRGPGEAATCSVCVQEPFLPSLTLQGALSQVRAAPTTATATTGHPSDILNRLPQQQQQKFLEQFLSLAPEHQSFVYRKLLSSPPDIQQFAIDQFVSLDNRVLVVSIQAELDKETQRRQPQQQQQQQFIGPALPRTSQSQLPSRFPSNQFGGSSSSSDLRGLNPSQLSIEQLVTLQAQLLHILADKYFRSHTHTFEMPFAS